MVAGSAICRKCPAFEEQRTTNKYRQTDAQLHYSSDGRVTRQENSANNTAQQHWRMDRKGLEIVKFLLDWHYLLTEPPVEGSIPEIYFCFVCSVYSKGKDKVSWLQFMKYLKLIDNLCNGNTLVCMPKNALLQRYEDPFSCFDKIVYINRLSLSLLLRASTNTTSTANNINNRSHSPAPSDVSASDVSSTNHPTPPSSSSSASGGDASSAMPPLSGPSTAAGKVGNGENENGNGDQGDNYQSDANSIGTSDTSIDIGEPYKRKTLDEYLLATADKDEIPKSRQCRLKYVLDMIEGEKPIASENDIYPIKMITNKRLVPKDINDTYTLTTRSNRLEQLEYLLNTPCSSHSIQRERARLRTLKEQFYDCCEDQEHAALLSSVTTFDKNTSYCKINEEKMKRLMQSQTSSSYSQSGSQRALQRFDNLYKCIEENMHFIPIIQSQTDLKLGDCSYLDTCHKMSTCRYVHYGQLMPFKFNNNGEISDDQAEEKEQELLEIKENIRIWDYTRGESICSYLKCDVPAQWINCDLMKIDFNVFSGDYGVVIADPSWTIHMNLNYSSLKDDELLSLRMDKLQSEGLFLLWVTGRTIETGRDFLNKWGYRVINQITWIKTSQLIRTISTGRTGHWLNHSKEHLLVGLKGDAKWLNKSIDAQILISSTRETSRKPDEIYGMVDRMVAPGVKKLEIFGRQHNTRPGWLTVGNQLGDTHLVETELAQRYDAWLASTGGVLL